jgi:hypothetical protein
VLKSSHAAARGKWLFIWVARRVCPFVPCVFAASLIAYWSAGIAVPLRPPRQLLHLQGYRGAVTQRARSPG